MVVLDHGSFSLFSVCNCNFCTTIEVVLHYRFCSCFPLKSWADILSRVFIDLKEKIIEALILILIVRQILTEFSIDLFTCIYVLSSKVMLAYSLDQESLIFSFIKQPVVHCAHARSNNWNNKFYLIFGQQVTSLIDLDIAANATRSSIKLMTLWLLLWALVWLGLGGIDFL